MSHLTRSFLVAGSLFFLTILLGAIILQMMCASCRAADAGGVATILSMGGKVEAFYYAFGETDLYAIVDMPDNVSVAAFALTIAASGAVSLKTTVLMTPEEIDKAVKKSPSYRPPGK